MLAACPLLASCQRGAPTPAAPDRAADEAAIRGVLEAVATEFNAGRMEQMVRHIHMFKRQADGSWKGWRLMENSADPAGVPPPPTPATSAP